MATVSTHLTDIADKLKFSDDEKSKINTSIDTIKKRINGYFKNDISYQVEDVIIFGSYARGTIVKNSDKSDIDIMVIFKNSAEYKPQTFLTKLKEFANNSYSASEIKQSSPTIKIELNHIIFELVPAYQKYLQYGLTDYYIPETKDNHFSTDGWQKTDFIEFNKQIKEKCQNSSTLYRLILLMKSWCAKNKYIQSYSLEKFIVDTYYYNCNTLFDYLYTFTTNSSWNVKQELESLRAQIIKAKNYKDQGYENSAIDELKKIKF
ncbi:SMODS domain-containing nucleotidyltransferase [Candidatus Deianiraea vastatrix]|uniref:Nucleotidyltransferase domain n=1 Tax=Candidatus Deianiraea vastatrix TaxID=2163644 RepID=A0A5B8XCS9_9RICK|nr:nucleotidyltransferase domain-containing protein [Candidatus Deianiraea vastatrix]QED23040.1 Putative nucleotidyltransferase domain [Candidatus Deianiraea vastatrix]